MGWTLEVNGFWPYRTSKKTGAGKTLIQSIAQPTSFSGARIEFLPLHTTTYSFLATKINILLLILHEFSYHLRNSISMNQIIEIETLNSAETTQFR
jgi:hypothetical protein